MDGKKEENGTRTEKFQTFGGFPPKPTLESRLLRAVEKILAAFMLAIVVWGMVILAVSISWLTIPEDSSRLYISLEQILSDILLLVVGLELAIMLVNRKIEYLLDIMLFVIARKMLIGVAEMPEILMGVAALAGLFAVRRYLLISSDHMTLSSDREPGNINKA